MLGQQSCAVPAPELSMPKILVSRVELTTITAQKSDPKVIESFREIGTTKLWPSNRFRIRVTLKTESGVNDAVVWTVMQSLVAPMARNFVSGKLDPVDYVSWGWDMQFKDLGIQRTSVGTEDKTITFGPFDATPMLPDSTDNLWPWALRVIVHVNPVSGPESTFTSHVYRLKPSATRQKLAVVDFDPAAPDGEPIPKVPNKCPGTELDSHPK
jgi:hypothetical protein